MDSYTSKEDPVMHMNVFQSTYNDNKYSDEDWCHAFVNTLTRLGGHVIYGSTN